MNDAALFAGHGICDSLCKSSTLPVATDNADIIAQECCSLLRQIKVDPEDLRGVKPVQSISLSCLYSRMDVIIHASKGHFCRRLVEKNFTFLCYFTLPLQNQNCSNRCWRKFVVH